MTKTWHVKRDKIKERKQAINCISVDGDDLRHILVNKDYSEKGRRKNKSF